MIVAKEIIEQVEQFITRPTCLILEGEKGLGKAIIAEYIAKKLLGVDSLLSCPDFYKLAPSNGSILLDDLSDLKTRFRYCAVSSSFKIFMIDDADTMNVNAQNAILKMLEDGNATNIFIFVAHKSLLDTICSRCQTIKVPIPSTELIKASMDNYDEEIMKLAENRIGIYYQLMDDKDYVLHCKGIINKLFTMDRKREILEVFGVLKEKDSNSFFELYPCDKVQLLLRYLKNVFAGCVYVHYGLESEYPVTDRYDLEDCINIISAIDDHCLKMQRKGMYTKNDFFSLICNLVN